MAELHPIQLQIQQPTHEQIFVATGTANTVSVPLQGTILETAFPTPNTLFRTWYSSLLDTTLATTDQAMATLPVGSHTLTYTVKDKSEIGVQPTGLEALYKSVTQIGASGGPPAPPPADGRPCVIHVLAANILAPANNANLSKASAVLEAQAPLQWGKFVANAAAFPAIDPNYHAVNKVQYRWFFTRITPVGPPIELAVQGGLAMTLIPPHDAPPPKVDPPPRLRYTGVLPAALVVDQKYTLTLRVEHADFPAQGHEATRTVTIKL